MKKQKIFNIVFPIWMFMLIPENWIIILPLSYIWITIILLIALCISKVDNKNEIYKNSIIKVWLFGFLASLIGATLMSIPTFFNTKIEALNNIGSNPYRNPISLLYLLLVIVITTCIIYLFNKKCSFSSTAIDHVRKNKIAKIITICTLPYLFLIPTEHMIEYLSKLLF